MGIHIFVPPQSLHRQYATALMQSINREDKHRICFGTLTPEAFVSLSSPPASWLFVGAEEDASTTHMLGFLWLTQFKERSALLHFGFTKRGRRMGVALARKAFQQAFDAGLSCIHGLFPQSYRHIYPFATRLGGTNMGIIPASCRNAYTGHIDNGVLWLFTPKTVPCTVYSRLTLKRCAFQSGSHVHSAT